MHLGSIYLFVKDFERAKDFYSQILNIPVTAENKGRFAMFNFEGHCIALLNSYFDRDHPELVKIKGQRDNFFDDSVAIAESQNSKKFVFNFWTENLNEEYERIKSLNITPRITKIKYICYSSPYYYFQFCDLDENIIEVTGPFYGEIEE